MTNHKEFKKPKQSSEKFLKWIKDTKELFKVPLFLLFFFHSAVWILPFSQ